MSKRKKLLLDENTELATKVKEVEEIISEPLTIFTDDDEWIAYRKLKKQSTVAQNLNEEEWDFLKNTIPDNQTIF